MQEITKGCCFVWWKEDAADMVAEVKMKVVAGTLTAIIVAALEIGLVILDYILLLGFYFANNVDTPLPGKISLALMCIVDPVAFGLSWVKPKSACFLLVCGSALTLCLSLIASNRHNLQSLWLSGLLFWTVKFFLAAFFWYKGMRLDLRSPA